jgi:hypothetical protein
MRERIHINGAFFQFYSPETDAELERAIDLIREVHGEGAAALGRAADAGLPGMKRAHWYVIAAADAIPGKDEALSAACLMPGEWTVGTGPASRRVQVAELGLVATRESARGKGLFGEIMRRWEIDAANHGFALASIEGIPYFYRRYGFEYAVALSVQLRLGPGMAPWREALAEAPEGKARLETREFRRAGLPGCRLAGPDDIPALAAAFERVQARHSPRKERDEALWRYLYGPGAHSHETRIDRWLIESPEGGGLAYLGTAPDQFGRGLAILEASPGTLPPDAILAIADAMRAELKRPFLTLELPASHPVSERAVELGAAFRRPYAWQLKTIDRDALLDAVAPSAAESLRGSRFSRKPFAVTLGLYGARVGLSWNGEELRVRGADDSVRASADVPPELLAPLALGYRDFDELRAVRHDLIAEGEAAEFMRAAFPKRDGFIYPWF